MEILSSPWKCFFLLLLMGGFGRQVRSGRGLFGCPLAPFLRVI